MSKINWNFFFIDINDIMYVTYYSHVKKINFSANKFINDSIKL